jgi:type IV fimbrial biogenesis protein FimT
LVELMVTIAIVAILLAVGLPSFQTSLRSNRVATTTNEMLASLSLARTEAIKTTNASRICARNGNVCGTDWNQGWLVVTDSDGNGTDFETTIKAVDGHPNLSITMAGGADNTFVQFDRTGRMGGASRTVEISPDADDAMDAHFRCMTITPIGQVNTEKAPCE